MAKVISMTEENMLEGCRRGDRNSQRQLYEKYFETMYWVCYRYLKDQTVAEDVVHDGFMKVYRNIKKYAGNGSFEGWMKRLMVNCCLDYLRKQKRIPHQVEIDQAYGYEVDAEVVEGLQAEYILELVNDLAPIHRTVFNLNVIEGYPHKEIARLLDIKDSTSRAYLTEAKKILRKQLAKAGAGIERRVKNG